MVQDTLLSMWKNRALYHNKHKNEFQVKKIQVQGKVKW